MAVDLNTQALTSRLADVSSTTGGLRHILEAAAARGTDNIYIYIFFSNMNSLEDLRLVVAA